MRKQNDYAIFEGHAEIYLKMRSGRTFTCKVDVSDLEMLLEFPWRVIGPDKTTRYTKTRLTTCGLSINMHKMIMGHDTEIEVVDHINGDGLDNRRCNLRICTQANNQKNRRSHIKKFKGTTYHKRDEKFQASLKVEGKMVYLGYFKTEVEAAQAYNNAAVLYFGEFARLNKLGQV